MLRALGTRSPSSSNCARLRMARCADLLRTMRPRRHVCLAGVRELFSGRAWAATRCSLTRQTRSVPRRSSRARLGPLLGIAPLQTATAWARPQRGVEIEGDAMREHVVADFKPGHGLLTAQKSASPAPRVGPPSQTRSADADRHRPTPLQATRPAKQEGNASPHSNCEAANTSGGAVPCFEWKK
jgi:hypothetical protein